MKFSIESFLEMGSPINYKKKEHILRYGEVSRNVYFVVEGVVRHYVIDYLGNEKTIRLSQENDFFYSSNISYWKGDASYINCQALLNTRLLSWTKHQLDHLSSIEPAFVLFESNKLREFIMEKHKKEISSITKNAEERLLEFSETNIDLFNRIPNHIIASYLDMTPETLSRLRAKFKNPKS